MYLHLETTLRMICVISRLLTISLFGFRSIQVSIADNLLVAKEVGKDTFHGRLTGQCAAPPMWRGQCACSSLS